MYVVSAVLEGTAVLTGSQTGLHGFRYVAIRGIVPDMSDEQPIRFDMAFPGASPLTGQPADSMTRFERLSGQQPFHDGPELVNALVTPPGATDVLVRIGLS